MKLSRLRGARAGEAPPDVLGDPGSTPGPGERLAYNAALVPGGQAGAVLAVPFCPVPWDSERACPEDGIIGSL